MDNDRYYELFNNTLLEFIKDLIIVFSDDKDFKLFNNSIKLLKLADVTKPLQLFKSSLTDEYKKNIQEKNVNFFLNNDYSDVLNNDNIKKNLNQTDDINNQIIKKLKGYWKDLNDENRDIIWNYFNILLKITNKITISS